MVNLKYYRKRQLALLLVASTVLLTSCGYESSGVVKRAEKTPVQSEDITLHLWVPNSEIEMVDQLVQNFDAVHEEYNIKYTIEGLDLADSINLITETEEELADIFYVPSGGIPALVEQGYLLPFTEPDFDKLSVDMPETAVSAVKVDGNAYAVPFSPNSFFMFYNTDFYSEDEVKSLDTMMAKDFGPGKYNFSTCITDSWYLEMFFLGNGCTLYGEDGTDPATCTFNSASGVDAANYAIALSANPKYIDNSQDGYDEFMAGNVGAYTTGAWAAPELREALGDKLSAAPLPVANIGGNEAQLSNFIDFKTIAVNKNSANPIAAQKLSVYLANKDSSLRRYQMFGDIPVLHNLANNERIKGDYSAMALNEQANYATNQPNISQMDNYWGPMAEFGTEILEGQIDSLNVKGKLDYLVNQITTNVPDAVGDATFEDEINLQEDEETTEEDAEENNAE